MNNKKIKNHNHQITKQTVKINKKLNNRNFKNEGREKKINIQKVWEK